MVEQLNFMKKELQEQKSGRCHSWMSKCVPKCWRVFAALLVAYVTAYCVLTLNGAYAPSAFDLRHVIAYQWAPLGFYTAKRDVPIGRWNTAMLWSFLPLWYVDIHLFHKTSLDGKSPA